MRDDTWRPPSPPESVASFSSTVVPFDSVSQVGSRPPKHHHHHNHSRHSHESHDIPRSTPSRSPRYPEPWRTSRGAWHDVEVYEPPPRYYSSPRGSERLHPESHQSHNSHNSHQSHQSHHSHHSRSHHSRPRSSSPSARESWANGTRSSVASSHLRSHSSSRTPTASYHSHSNLESESPPTSASSKPYDEPAPPSAHLIEEETRIRHHVKVEKADKPTVKDYDVVQVELDSDEEEGSYRVLRTHRYPVYTHV